MAHFLRGFEEPLCFNHMMRLRRVRNLSQTKINGAYNCIA